MSEHKDRGEAIAALRKALGLEQLLGRLRSDGDMPVAIVPSPSGVRIVPQEHAPTAA